MNRKAVFASLQTAFSTPEGCIWAVSVATILPYTIYASQGNHIAGLSTNGTVVGIFGLYHVLILCWIMIGFGRLPKWGFVFAAWCAGIGMEIEVLGHVTRSIHVLIDGPWDGGTNTRGFNKQSMLLGIILATGLALQIRARKSFDFAMALTSLLVAGGAAIFYHFIALFVTWADIKDHRTAIFEEMQSVVVASADPQSLCDTVANPRVVCRFVPLGTEFPEVPEVLGNPYFKETIEKWNSAEGLQEIVDLEYVSGDQTYSFMLMNEGGVFPIEGGALLIATNAHARLTIEFANTAGWSIGGGALTWCFLWIGLSALHTSYVRRGREGVS